MAEIAAALGIAASAVGTATDLHAVAQNIYQLALQFKERGPQLRLFKRHLEQLAALLKATARDFEQLAVEGSFSDLKLGPLAVEQVKLRIQEGLKHAYDVDQVLTRVVDDLRLELKRSVIIQRFNKNRIGTRWEELSDGRQQLLMVLAPLNAVHQLLSGVDVTNIARNVQHLTVAKEKRIKDKEEQKKLQRRDEAWKKRQALDKRLCDYLDCTTGSIMKIIRPSLNWASFAVEGSATWAEDQELTVNELLEMVANLSKSSETDLHKSSSAPATPHASPMSQPHRTISDFSGNTHVRERPNRGPAQTSAWSSTTPTSNSTMNMPIQTTRNGHTENGETAPPPSDETTPEKSKRRRASGVIPSVSSSSGSMSEEKVSSARAESLAQLQGALMVGVPSSPFSRAEAAARPRASTSDSKSPAYAWLTPTSPGASASKEASQRRESSRPGTSTSSSKFALAPSQPASSQPSLPGAFPKQQASVGSLRPPSPQISLPDPPTLTAGQASPSTVSPFQSPPQQHPASPEDSPQASRAPTDPSQLSLHRAIEAFTLQNHASALPLLRALLRSRQDGDLTVTALLTTPDTVTLLRNESLDALYIASALYCDAEGEVVRYGGLTDHVRDSAVYSADKTDLKAILLRALALMILASQTEEDDSNAVKEAAGRMVREAEGICKAGFRRAGQLFGGNSEGARDVARMLQVIYGVKGEERLRREWEGVIGERIADGKEWLEGKSMVANMFAVKFGWPKST